MYASLSYRTKTDFFDVICVTVVLRVITMASTSFLMSALLEFTWPCLRGIRTAEDNEITASAGTRLAMFGNGQHGLSGQSGGVLHDNAEVAQMSLASAFI